MVTRDSGQENSERRRHDRLDKNFSIRYRRLEDLSDDVPDMEGELLDIGGGGARFLGSESLSKNTQLTMVLEFPGWMVADGDEWTITRNSNDVGILKVIGRVMWVAPCESDLGKYEIGVSFSGRIL